jgi:hypothetical protein
MWSLILRKNSQKRIKRAKNPKKTRKKNFLGNFKKGIAISQKI